MSKNRAHTRAVRARMRQAGETYTQALRALQTSTATAATALTNLATHLPTEPDHPDHDTRADT